MKRLPSLLTGLGVAFGSLVAAGQADDGPPRFEVSAIVMQEGGASWTMMAEPRWTQGAMRPVALGGRLGPYTLVEVAADHVIMRGPDGSDVRVPFSWRGTEAGPPATGHRVQELESGSRRPDTRETDEARRARRRERSPATAPGGAPGDAAPSVGRGESTQELDLRELSGDLPPQTRGQLEEFIRLRDRALQEDAANQGAGRRR